MNKHKREKRKGFTIIELLVASAIFTTFLAIAVGSFTRVIQVQRVLSRRIMLTSSLGSAIESMAREIRVGIKFNDPDGMNVEDVELSSLSFENFANHVADTPAGVTFSLSGGAILKNGKQLTPSDVVVESLLFRLDEKLTVDGNCGPWRVTIIVKAHPKGFDQKEDTINLQTTVESRVLPEEVKEDPYQCKKM